MGLGFDANFSHHEKALGLYADRSEILANNLVNADTPGFLARDLDFKAMLEKAFSDNDNDNDNYDHKTGENLLYRVPLQTSMDGNTVDGEVEKTQFAENSMRYMATLSFLTHEFTKLKMVINNQ